MESPFHDRLDTNYCPSDEEILGIHAVVDANARAAASIDADINRLLDSRCPSCFANRHISLLSPMRRVPDDILSTIFAHLHIEAQDPISRTHPAVVVSHVAQRWRRLAISIQSLWSGIHLLLPQYPTPSPQTWGAPGPMALAEDAVDRWDAIADQTLATARTWLVRSGHCPIDVTLSAILLPHSEDCSGFTRQVERCLDSLCSAAHRWRRAYFDLSFGPQQSDVADTLEPLTLLQPHHVPRLEFLQLSVLHHGMPRRSHAHHPIIPTIAILRGPALRALDLPTVSQNWQTLPVNWSTLKELRFSTALHGPREVAQFTTPEAFFLLKECHSLVSCDIVISSPSRLAAASSRPITGVASLPNLQALAIQGPIPTKEFVQALRLPTLNSLEFGWSMESEPPGTSHQSAFTLGFGPTERRGTAGTVLEWAQRLGHQLRTVKLNIAWIAPNVLKTLLKCIPNVSDLSLRFSSLRDLHWAPRDDTGVAHLLTLRSSHKRLQSGAERGDKSAGDLCPRLRRLHLDMVGQPESITEEEVRDMIASRRRVSSNVGISEDSTMLQDVTIEFGSARMMDIQQDLESRGVSMTNFRFEANYTVPIPQPLRTDLLSPTFYRQTRGAFR
ncbi:hypothetical protein FA13DRAFT_1734838 [Coprinellus micaceus]|uniref:F-box domain-containing protein n=1 Tax=Coprinellus micaceus TaxID=71717 RepID=A0A4Y7T4X8_COPMI|nr:hypothetical protein FA13DRAFT_1734838 [Coprinellus micaceus]